MRREVNCQAKVSTYRSGPWMRDLPNQLISELTIPGTHDSCCSKDCGVLKCQNWSLAEQLSEGIRFLDIRCRHVTDSFNIHHDYMYCDLSLHNVLDTCKTFLENFPSECLVMRVKEEYKPFECSRSFQETFKSYVEEYKDILCLQEDVPYLNDLRSKIWVICDFQQTCIKSTFKWSKALIQDMWQIDDYFMVQTKIRKIEDHVRQAVDGKKNELFFNFCSGTGEYAWPIQISKKTNKIVYKFKGRFGVVVFDFPEKGEIIHLIKQNKPNCSYYDYPIKFISEKNFILDVFNKVNRVILFVFKSLFTQKSKIQKNNSGCRKGKFFKIVWEEDGNLNFIYKSFQNIQIQFTNNKLRFTNFLPMPLPITNFLPFENFRSAIKLSDY